MSDLTTILVVAGSLPDSVPPAVAGRIVGIGKAAGARTLVDIHGAALRVAIDAAPWMVKCNLAELLALADADGLNAGGLAANPLASIPGVAARMVALRASGIELVVVTLGAEGVLLADGTEVVHAAAPRVDVVNPTGSGDLVLAGLVVGIERGLTPRDALVLGAACGTAGATHLLPELPPDFAADAWTSRISDLDGGAGLIEGQRGSGHLPADRQGRQRGEDGCEGAQHEEVEE